MSEPSRWRKAVRVGLVGLTSCAMVFGVAVTATAANTPPAGAPAAATTATSAFAQELESKYIDPDRVYSADARWWLGEAAHTDEVLLEEIQALYDSGFRGVELAMQGDNGAPDATYAYGTEMWTHKWNLMMNKLLDLGMGVYLTSGTNWATSNIAGLDPTSQAAMQNITLGTGTVNPGVSITALTAPAANAQRAGAKFVTAYAYKVVSGNTVDPNSFVDLKSLVTQGADVWTQNLNWTAPADGTYRVFGLWTQGTFQTSTPSATPSYATNYFDVRGVAALKEFWEAHYLADPALRAKIAAGDVQLFMDSLEMTAGTGGATWWAEDMAQQFQARKGYDITPHLYLIAGVASNVANPYHAIANTGTYRIDGAEGKREDIIADYQDVLTQLYMERMLKPLKTWLNSVGIETRAQNTYGKPFENSETSMELDYPEAEDLNQYDQVDIFRLWTGAAKLEDKVLSSETGASTAQFSTSQADLRKAYSSYAAGFQRIIWHVWGAGYSYSSIAWPGHNATSFRQFGTRHPFYATYDELNAHLGRVQQLLQTGEARSDIGFIHQNWPQGVRFGGGIGNVNTGMNWQFAHQGVYYRSTELQDNGYTYDYFSPRFLFDDDVSFDPTTKTIEKAGYKALVIYQQWLELAGAKRILDWAKQGLPVVFLADAASRTPFYDGKEAELAAVVAELKSLKNVRTATVADIPAGGYFSADPGGYDDNVMELLQELGVDPYAGYAEENHQLLTQTRVDEDGNEYLYVYNYCPNDYHANSHKAGVRTEDHGTNIKTDVEVAGTFIPYQIDAWTGEVTELADYSWVDGKTVIPVDLDYGNVSLFAFEKVDAEATHIVSTTGESSSAVDDGVAVRATATGALTTTLTNGIEFGENVAVPTPYDIADWNLTVQSWRPNATQGDLIRTETIGSVSTTNRKTSTIKTALTATLPTLTTWNNIPGIGRAVSGTGHYEAKFNWDAKTASGAYLDFGSKIESTMEVFINGQRVGGQVSANPTKVKKDVGGVGKPTIDDGKGNQVPLVGTELITGGVNWTKPVVDVSEYLKDGENKIVIEYYSSLMNVQLDRGIMAPAAHRQNWWGNYVGYQDYGPKQAKLVPFVEAEYPSDVFAGVRWNIDSAAKAGDLTGNALKQVRKHVEQAEMLSVKAPRDAIDQVDNAIRKSASSPAVVKALEALKATLS